MLVERCVKCAVRLATKHKHTRLTSKSVSTVNKDHSVTVLEVCRCGAHRELVVDKGRVTKRKEWA